MSFRERERERVMLRNYNLTQLCTTTRHVASYGTKLCQIMCALHYSKKR